LRPGETILPSCKFILHEPKSTIFGNKQGFLNGAEAVLTANSNETG
jgi:hypothetical protein